MLSRRELFSFVYVWREGELNTENFLGMEESLTREYRARTPTKHTFLILRL